jgi:hypothetical protein
MRPLVWFGFSVSALGFGLMCRFFRYPFSVALEVGLTSMTAIGIGLSLAVPMLIMQAAMPLKEMASTTAAWQLSRAMGGSVGTPYALSCLGRNAVPYIDQMS